jgi:hypothetical protein
MPKFMCIKTTVADRLYEEGKIYEFTEAPNKHFKEIESPKAEMKKNLGSARGGTKGEKKDDSTLKFME